MRIILFLSLTLLAACMTPYASLEPLRSMEDLSYPFAVQKQTVLDGIDIAYIDEGKGAETILFIHGLGSYLPAWKKNVEVLKEQYRCIAIDLPGYGKSGKGPWEGSMVFNAQVVVAFLDSLGIEKVTLAGHSMGGQISMVTALAYPDRVKRLILAAPAGFEVFDEGEKQWFREVVTAKGTKLTTAQQIQANLASNFYNLPADAEFMITDRIAMRGASDFDWYCYIIPKSVQGMVDRPVFDYLPDIQQPTLIVFGEFDNLIPNRFLNGGRTIDIAKTGHERIPNSELVMVPKCGHFVQWEGASTFNQAVQNFMQR